MFCLIHRWKIDRALDDNQELPRSTKTHIANCPNCREHYQQQARLIEQLEQPSPTPEAPPFLQTRIINALQSSETKPEPTLSVPVWVPIAACAVIAFFLYPRTASLPSPLDPPAAIPKKYPSVPRANGSITILNRSSPEPVESLRRSLAKTFAGVRSKHLTPRYKASSVRINETSVCSDASFPSRGSTCPKFRIFFARIHSSSFKTPSITGFPSTC